MNRRNFLSLISAGLLVPLTGFGRTVSEDSDVANFRRILAKAKGIEKVTEWSLLCFRANLLVYPKIKDKKTVWGIQGYPDGSFSLEEMGSQVLLKSKDGRTCLIFTRLGKEQMYMRVISRSGVLEQTHYIEEDWDYHFS